MKAVRNKVGSSIERSFYTRTPGCAGLFLKLPVSRISGYFTFVVMLGVPSVFLSGLLSLDRVSRD